MNQEFRKSQKLKKWLRWMKIIRNELQPLIWEAKIFWEVQDIICNNPDIQMPSYFYHYLGHSYISHAVTGLRRQIKQQKDSISLCGLLEEIKQYPTELSLSYYRSCREKSKDSVVDGLTSIGIDITKEEFLKYADPSAEHVCPKKVATDIDKLKEATKTCEEFADRRVAHRDKREPKVVPTYEQLDDCIKLLDETYVKYHLIFYAEGMITLCPEPQYDWKAIFRKPWLVDIPNDV